MVTNAGGYICVAAVPSLAVSMWVGEHHPEPTQPGGAFLQPNDGCKHPNQAW